MDMDFQMFSPLRTPHVKKKKKSKPDVPVVPSSDINSDSELDEDILKIAKRVSDGVPVEIMTSPKGKRKSSSKKASPSKRSRISSNADEPLTSTQITSQRQGHVMSESESEIFEPSQKRCTRQDTPDLFSNLDSETDTERPLTQKIMSPKKQSRANGSQLNVTIESPTKAKEVKSPKKAPQRKDSSSSSGSESESDSQTKKTVPTKDVSMALQKQSESSSGSSSSDSDSEPETPRKKLELDTPKKTLAPTRNTSHAKALRYECLAGFKEVEFSKTPLTVEDLGASDEIWILRLDANYDVSRLDGKDFPVESVVQLGKGQGSNVDYQLHSSHSKTQKTAILLPSKTDKKLHYAGQVVGQVWLSQSLNIPHIPLPKPRPPRDTSLPPGLKFRNVPFGAGPTKSTDSTDLNISSRGRKKKDKKKRKSHEATMEVDVTVEETPENVDDVAIEPETKKAKKKKKKHKKDKE